MTARRQTALLLAGDCACFLAFALLGLRNHDEGITAAGVLRNAVPFGAAWIAFAVLNGLYRHGWHRDDDSLWLRLAQAWLPAWLLGLALRSLYVWRWPVPAFASITLVTVAVFLILWRSLATLLLKRARTPA
jgi:hypothetical protein